MSLYRAYAYVKESAAPEVAVFFLAHSHTPALQMLPRILMHAWAVTPPQVDFYNVASESELLRHALGPESDGDVRLFEAGGHMGAPTYLPAERVQLLVHPARLGKLQKALAIAQRRLEQAEAAAKVWPRNLTAAAADLVQEKRA